MRAKKHIGIMFPLSKGGGVFQYALSIAESLIQHSPAYTYSIIHYRSENPLPFLLKQEGRYNLIHIAPPSIKLTKKLFYFMKFFFSFLFPPITTKNYKTLKEAGIDLLIIPTPLTYELPIPLPYIASIPDFMYKYFPHFHTWRDRLTRDIVYGWYARHAKLLIADSSQTVDDLVTFTAVRREKIRIIPYIPSGYIYQHKNMGLRKASQILKDYNLPKNFLFYPAQFWYQKNHTGLVKTLFIIKRIYGITIPLVLVGHSKGYYQKTYNAFLSLIKKLNMTNQVIYLGYVSELEIVALYKKALALVYPSLTSAPTAIPPLEAMVLGTPVLVSNIFELPKQVGKAGLSFNPSDVNDMSKKIYILWKDGELRKRLIQKGYERAKQFTMKSYAQQWEEVIRKALSTSNNPV